MIYIYNINDNNNNDNDSNIAIAGDLRRAAAEREHRPGGGGLRARRAGRGFRLLLFTCIL